MNIRYRAIALPVLALAMLSGCQSFPFLGNHTAASDTREVDTGAYFDRRLADGRRHLEANRLASAVTAFRQASYDPDLAAAAHNGMAVAYDRLGRSDLAERYFISAMRLDPANSRYSNNFALFTETHIGEISERRSLALAEEQAGTGERFTPAPAAEPAEPSSRVRRVSAREIHIAASSATTDERTTTRSNSRADTINVQRRAARLAHSDSYPIRIPLASLEAEQKAEPRRTRLARIPTPRRHKGYPTGRVFTDGES